MTVGKLVAGVKGSSTNSTGQDIADTVNAQCYIAKPPPEITSLPPELANLIIFGENGGWWCNISPSDLWNTTGITNTIRVDSRRPNDAGSGSTWLTAKRSIGAAIAAANASGVATRILVMGGDDGTYHRAISIGNDSLPKTLTVPVTIEAQYGRVVTGTFDLLTWAKTSGQTNVWQATRSGVQSVWNTTLLDKYGSYKQYKYVDSIINCDSTPGSFYTDNTTLYVHTHTSSPANNLTVRAYLNDAGADFKTPHNLLVSGIDFEGGNNSPFTCRDGASNIVIMKDCTAKFGANGILSAISGKDGIQVLGCKIFAAFDSEASRNGKDGFNIHIQGSVKPFPIIGRCKGFRNGFVSTSTSNNGITAHDGCQGIEFGGVFKGSVGANVGHVDNDTIFWHVGTIAGDSDGDTPNGGTWDWGAFGIWNGSGKMILEKCTDTGSAIGIYADGGATVRLIDHKGSGRRVGSIS